MIKIKLNNNEKYVTKGAYNEFYEHLGYKIVDENKKPMKEIEPKKEVEIKNTKEVEKVTKETYSRK